jgi:4-amino-4-deoxy-L-arabinose transferase-like glycosyltransferase
VNFQISNKLKIFLSSLAAAVVLLLVVFWGANTGKQIAQAQFIAATSQNAAGALQYFYQDQNRYPTAEEFENQNLMLNYLSNFPLPNYVSAKCSQSFVYKRIDTNSFQLSFCLPVAEGNYQAGWNNLSGSSGK